MNSAGPTAEYAAALVKPGRALAKMGITLPPPRLRGNPLLWRYLPLGVVARTLVDHDLVVARTVWPSPDVMKGPGFWHFRWRDYPRGPRNALYQWLSGEWNRYGYILAEGRNWLGWEIRQQASPPEWIDGVRALIRVRNALAMCAGLTPRPEPEPTMSPQYPGTIWPEVADYVHALDQSIDRIQDTLRSLLLDRLVRGECTEGERAEAVALLQRDWDAGRWPEAVRKLNEACGAPEPVLLRSL